MAAAIKKSDPPAMKDRSNIAALVLALEAVVMTLAKARVAGLDAAGKAAFQTDVSASLDLICGEVIAQAPVTGRGTSMAPAAARAAAMRIEQDARDLLTEYSLELFGSVPKS